MFNSKYIIVTNDYGIITPVIFPDIIEHTRMATLIGGKIIGAGFCFITPEGIYSVYGDSVSLELESKPDDATMLNKYLGVTDPE